MYMHSIYNMYVCVCVCVCVCVERKKEKLLSHVWLFAIPWTVAD